MTKKRRKPPSPPIRPASSAEPATQASGGQAAPQQGWTFEAHFGPLPPPDQLEKYEELLPGAVATIFEAFRTQTQHRQEIEGRVVRSNTWSQKVGLVMGFVLAMTAILGSILLIATGYTAGGSILGSVNVVGLAYVFVRGRRLQAQERIEKYRAVRRR